MAVIELSAVLSGKSETKALGGKQITLGATLYGRSAGSGGGAPERPKLPQPVQPGTKD